MIADSDTYYVTRCLEIRHGTCAAPVARAMYSTIFIPVTQPGSGQQRRVSFVTDGGRFACRYDLIEELLTMTIKTLIPRGYGS